MPAVAKLELNPETHSRSSLGVAGVQLRKPPLLPSGVCVSRELESAIEARNWIQVLRGEKVLFSAELNAHPVLLIIEETSFSHLIAQPCLPKIHLLYLWISTEAGLFVLLFYLFIYIKGTDVVYFMCMDLRTMILPTLHASYFTCYDDILSIYFKITSLRIQQVVERSLFLRNLGLKAIIRPQDVNSTHTYWGWLS